MTETSKQAKMLGALLEEFRSVSKNDVEKGSKFERLIKFYLIKPDNSRITFSGVDGLDATLSLTC